MDDLTLSARVAPFRDASAFAASVGALNLAQGLPEPLFDEVMNTALARQVTAGWQYADPRGEMILRESIAAHSGPGIAADSEVLVTSGCTESLYLALYAAATEFGNKVAFFEPFYPYYPGLAALLGIEPIPVPFSPGLQGPDWDALEQQVRAGVRILLINTPHNPTGWCMTGEDWQRLVALATTHAFVVIVDEAYGQFEYATHGPARYPRGQLPIMVAGSASKLLSMTGVRIGWLCAPASLIERAHAHHLYLSYCQPKPLQAAVAVLLDELAGGQLDGVRAHYKNKRDCLASALANAGFEFTVPAGGHYLMADYSRLDPSRSPVAFSQHLARCCGVMPLPATPFYLDHCPRSVRFSFSVAKPIVDQACARLEEL